MTSYADKCLHVAPLMAAFYATVCTQDEEAGGRYLHFVVKIFDLQVVERFVPFTVSHGKWIEEIFQQNMTCDAINYKFAQKFVVKARFILHKLMIYSSIHRMFERKD